MHDHGHEHSSHGHGHAHDYGPGQIPYQASHAPHWIFKLGVFLNVSFFIIDLFVWYFLTDRASAAIFGDSMHNGLHATAHIFALHGHGLEGESQADEESLESKLQKSRAAKKIGYLIIAGALLIGTFGGLQIYQPGEIASKWLIIIASLDIASNILLLGLLWRYRGDPTVKAVFADIKMDTLASVGVIVGGIVILFTGFYRADGIVTIPIALIALRTAQETIIEAKNKIKELAKQKSPD